jgi:EmrB/QacA subfamily drug resistance transporter
MTRTRTATRRDDGQRTTEHPMAVMLVLCVAQLVIAIDFSIVNVALPSIQSDLGLSDTGVQWVMTAFAVCFGGLLMLGGRTGDLFGRRRVFILGLWLFAASCVTAGLAESEATLLASRALQGVAGAFVAPSALALLTSSFAEGPERARALGLYGAVLSGGFVIGVLLGGLLTGAGGWRLVMFVNVAPALAAAVLARSILAESRAAGSRRGIDLPGAVAVSLCVASLVYAISAAPDAGWLSGQTLGMLAVSVAFLGGFLLIERRSAAPLVPLRTLRRRSVLGSNAVGLATFAACGGAVFALALYMHELLGYSPMQSGLAFCSLGLAAIAAGMFAEPVTGRIGSRAALLTGLSVQAAGTLALVALPLESGLPWLLLGATAAIGAGHVLAVVCFTTIATSGIPQDEQGVVGGLVNTTLQVGGAVGVAVYGAIVVAGSGAATPEPTRALAAFHESFAVGSALLVLGIIAALVALRADRRTSERTVPPNSVVAAGRP